MRRALIAAGMLVMAYAIAGAVTDPDVRLIGVLVFLAAVLVAHDAVLLPAVLAAGALISRFVPAGARGAVRAAAVASLAVTVVALPLVLGFGRRADNPSLLPRPYGAGLLLILGLIWATAVAWIVARLIHKHLVRSRRAAGG
jgi:hypothetical protein